jgi:uncharacterized protein YegL
MPRKIKLDGEEEKVEILLNILLDRSGSMNGSEARTVDSINEYLNGLKADKNASYRVTLAQFDSMPGQSQITEYVYKNIPLEKIEPMLVAQYKPRGNTPLYDALGEMIEGVQQKDQPVLLVTITDGQENASRKYDKLKIQSLRAEKEKNGWTFVFLGADLDAYEEASKVGYAAANVASYAKGAEAYMAQNLVASTMAYSETRSASLKSALAAGSSLTASLYNQERGEKFFDDADREKMLDKTKTPRKKK